MLPVHIFLIKASSARPILKQTSKDNSAPVLALYVIYIASNIREAALLIKLLRLNHTSSDNCPLGTLLSFVSTLVVSPAKA